MLRAHRRTETSARLPALSGCAKRKWIWPRATAPVAVPRAGSPAHQLPVIQELSRTLKPNQSEQKGTERPMSHQRVCPTVSQDCRCWKDPFVRSSLLLSQGNPLSLCLPAPKASLAGAQTAEFLTAWEICGTKDSEQLPHRFITVFTKAGSTRPCNDFQGGSTKSMSFI